jgi:Spy/CpxP family protein refolding chaperone
MTRTIRLLAILAAVAASAVPALAQDPQPRPAAERLRKVFTERLRQELQLTDAQAAEVVPRIEAIQRARSDERRQKMTAARELKAALADGSSDAAIEKILARLDEAEARRDQEIRARMKEVDAALSPRQRAELRFFIARFGREVERRIRGDAGPARRPERMPTRRPLPAPSAEAP